VRHAGAGGAVGRERRLKPTRLPVDAAVVPGLLLLLARDLLLFDPPRVLAWRLLHDPALAGRLGPLSWLLPAPSGALDRDPIALALACAATVLATVYAALAVLGARARTRAAVIAVAASLLVVLPTAALVGMGAASDRPYGQDGGVVQLPLALDRILDGESPYGADYSGTILAKQARVSSFWEEFGGNPILHHHAYLPGTHVVMLPFHIASRAILGFFDPRLVTLLFYGLAAALAARLAGSDDAALAAAALVALNPLVYWHQIFGANDLVFVAMVLASVLAARHGRLVAAGALLGLACATKQLAWPFAPFVLVALSGATGFKDLLRPTPWRRLLAPLGAAAIVFTVVVLPVAALDLRAFWGDIVVYNVGLSGGDAYPLGGTPGVGFLNFVLYEGGVSSLRDHYSLWPLYLLLVPFGLLLLRTQMRDGHPEMALVTGSAALLAAVYVSRVVHPNYLLAAAALLPVGVLARRLRPGVALLPLLLLLLAVDVATNEVLRTTWEQAAAADLPRRIGGLVAVLAPRGGPHLTRDPLGAAVSAIAVLLAVVALASIVQGRGATLRRAVSWAAFSLVVAVPLVAMVGVGARTGIIRAQAPEVVQAAGDARRLLALRSPYTPPPDDTPRGREAFATSFRVEPPVEIRPDRPLMPPLPSLLTAAAHLAGTSDIRIVTLLVLLGLGLLVSRWEPAGVSLVLLAAPLALGTVLGFTLALPLAALLSAAAAGERGDGRTTGLLAGLAVALDHRALFFLPVLLAPVAERPGTLRRAAGWATCAYLAIVLPVAALDPAAFAARLLSAPPPGVGLGLFNLLAWSGAEASAPARVLAALVPVALALAALGVARRGHHPLVGAGLLGLLGLCLAPTLPADAVAIPLVLLGLAALAGERTRLTGLEVPGS